MSEPNHEHGGPPLLHDPAPNFHARTTMGDRSLADYRGRWLLLFSHPADFTPVCTSEFIAFSKAADHFEELGCALLALSVDSLFSHFAWIRSIHAQFGVKVPFPIIEDPSMAIARAYGMIAPHAPDAHDISTPEGWCPGDDVILPPTLTAEAAFASHEQGADWYFRTGPLPKQPKGRGR